MYMNVQDAYSCAKGQSGMRTCIDLFSGAGGLSEGIRQAGFEIRAATDLLGAAALTHAANFPEMGDSFILRDIRTLDPEELGATAHVGFEELDLLIGGPPCQGFSVMWRADVEDRRNSLVDEYIRMVAHLRPRFFVLENVPGLFYMSQGAIARKMVQRFAEIGYRSEYRMLFAPDYGVPQERKRFILIGTRLPDLPIPFPEPTHGKSGQQHRLFDLPAYVTIGEAIDDLPVLEMGEGADEMEYSGPPRSPYQQEMRYGAGHVYNHVAPRMSQINLERFKYIQPGGSWRDIPFELLPAGMQRAKRSDHTKRYGRMDPGKLSCTLLTKFYDPHWGAYIHWAQTRGLTVREGARLQSFPDRFRFLGTREEQYKQVGNAVPPLLARAIGRAIMDALVGVEQVAIPAD